VTTSQGDDRVGPAEGPEHAGLFQAGSDDCLAAGFDYTGADEEVLTAELRITRTAGVALEVVGLGANLFLDLDIGGMDGAQRNDQLFNFPFIGQALLVSLYPGLPIHGIVGVPLACQLPQMLARAIEIDDERRRENADRFSRPCVFPTGYGMVDLYLGKIRWHTL
jgi:hypothetical protein